VEAMTITNSQLNLAAKSGDAAIAKLLQGISLPLVRENEATFLFDAGDAEAVFLQHWVFGLSSRIPFEKIGETSWWVLTLEFPLNSRIEYKIGVRQNGVEVWLHDPGNPRIAHDPFGGNSVVQLTGYVEPEWSLPDPETPQGTLETWSIPSRALGNERQVRVYLPARFRPNRRHRLLMVHDGDDYLRYSRLGAVLDNLTQRWEIPPLVVVLLNPQDRLREYGADPRHAAFVVEELLPEVERRYPVIADPSARCLAGASFGGVASLATAWYYPQTFDMLLLQSGSFAFTDIGLHTRGPVFDPVVAFMNKFRQSVGKPARKIYASCGIYESLIYENRSLVPLLQNAEVQVKFEEARDGHNWENWRDRLRNGLTWLFPVPLWFYYE
jgi:enterochelin esterase-like enzyme